jgi:hypothetical protein
MPNDSALLMPFDSPATVVAPNLSSPAQSAAQERSPSAPQRPRVIIQGVTTNGRAFRPSDWAERLCGIMSTFEGDQHMRYAESVRPLMLDGVRCVLVEPSLADSEPRAYRFLLDFARDNELVVIDPSAPLPDDVCPVPPRLLTPSLQSR